MAENPYQSPQADPSGVAPTTWNKSAPWQGVVVKRDWRLRRVRFEGRIEAELEWNARWPQETIRIDGHVVASRSVFWYAPRFEFMLDTSHGELKTTVDVVLSAADLFMFDAVRSFQITINGELAFVEAK